MMQTFERGVAIISIDTERMWGYRDLMGESRFQARFPDAPLAHTQLLAHLCAAQVSATWFVVGALALRGGTPEHSGRGPLWQCPTFLDCLSRACPAQEIGVHGGLTHLIWDDTTVTREAARRELVDGIKALDTVCKAPCSFSFPRNREAYHELLPENGIRAFRGQPRELPRRLGHIVPGVISRALDEVRRTTPPAVWPYETMPGLWNIPASMFLYPIGPPRSWVLGLRSRVERFKRGLEVAARQRAIFHFCLHPENVAESPQGVLLLQDLLDTLVRSRSLGDVEVLTMGDVLNRLQGENSYACEEQHQYPDLFETNRRG
jgi:hypothetical protein